MGSATTSTQCLTSHSTRTCLVSLPSTFVALMRQTRRSLVSQPKADLHASGTMFPCSPRRAHIPPPAPSACSEPLAIDIRSHTSLHTHTQRVEGAANSIAGAD